MIDISSVASPRNISDLGRGDGLDVKVVHPPGVPRDVTLDRKVDQGPRGIHYYEMGLRRTHQLLKVCGSVVVLRVARNRCCRVEVGEEGVLNVFAGSEKIGNTRDICFALDMAYCNAYGRTYPNRKELEYNLERWQLPGKKK